MSGILQTFFMYGAKEIVTANLLMYWDSGNLASYPTTGTAIDDLTTNNYDGTLNNGITFSASDGGKFILVNASNHWINSIGTDTGLPAVGTSDFSIEIWCRPSNINQQGYLLSNRSNSSGDRFSLHLGTVTFGGGFTDSKKLSFLIYNNIASFTREIVSTNDIIDGAWKQIVLTRTSDTFKLYANGIDQPLTTVRSLSGGATNIVTNTTWRIGDNGGGTGGANASIDSDISIVRLYNKLLSSTEVTQNFDAQKSRYGIS